MPHEHLGKHSLRSAEPPEGLLRDKKDTHREEFVKLVRVVLTVKQAQPAKIDYTAGSQPLRVC